MTGDPAEAALLARAPGADEIEIRFSGPHVLPEAALAHGAGPVTDALRLQGLATTTEAARWLRDLPYGFNAAADATAVLRDGQGTCVSKHACWLTAASELGLAAELVWGVYGLTDEIVTGVGPVLAAHRVPFVPTIHCFIACGGGYVDLTEGNCNGKNGLVERYLELHRAAVGADEAPVRAQVCRRLSAEHPGFAGVAPEAIAAAADACAAVMATACVRSDAPVAVDR